MSHDSLSLSPFSHFTTLCYTADGQCLLAGGRSKFVCLYDVKYQHLLKKYQTTNNQLYDGMKVSGLHTYTHITFFVAKKSCIDVQLQVHKHAHALNDGLTPVIIESSGPNKYEECDVAMRGHVTACHVMRILCHVIIA